jgi:hypothetical protein
MKTLGIKTKVTIGCMSLFLTALSVQPASAWFHGGGGSWSHTGFRGGSVSGGGGSWSGTGFRGGSASGGDGSWSGTGFRGGSASGGDGSWSGTGFRGGSASGGDGSWSGTGFRGGSASGGDGAWTAKSPYGTTVNGGAGYHTYYGGAYSTYHPPTVVNHYGSGCYNCGGWAAAGAAAAGAAIGAAIGAANNSVPEENSGSAYAIGAIYPSLPSGCVSSQSDGGNFYNCDGTWFSPAAGANGVYYRVVPAP